MGCLDERNYLVHQLPAYSVIVITCDDNHRNMKGHILLVVAFDIPFSLHLLRHDGAVHVMAMCHILIG